MATSLKWKSGGTDTSSLATKEELSKKQDALIPGDNVEITIDPVTGKSIISCSGEGGITEARLGEILEEYGTEITAAEVAALFE